MPIARLALTDFRNHASATIVPGPGFVLISGANGAGKTNILEAVSLLSPGRGLRGVALGEMARSEGTGGFGVAADLTPPARASSGAGLSPGQTKERPNWEEERSDDGEGLYTSTDGQARPPTPSRSGGRGGATLGTGTLPTAPERRQVRVNGAPAPVTALSEWLSVLWLTPAMDRLFADSAGSRRRFLDRLVLALEPGHAPHAARYEAAMRARNKLLAEPDSADPAWLAALEAGMAEHGAALADARDRTVSALAEAAASQKGDDFPRAGLALNGWQAGADLAAILRANRDRDAAAGRATQGPHRHDLAVTNLAKREPAARGSTGEQKALLLGLVLAHAGLVAARRGAPPILLLDEVAAHLDPARRAALFDRLAGRGQVWMTATEPALFDAIDGADATRLTVENGAIRPA